MAWLGFAVSVGAGGCAVGDPGSGDSASVLGDDSSGSGGGMSEGTGDGGAPEGDGSTGSAAPSCDDYEYGASPQAVAATPRADPDAEILAVLWAGTLTAPDDLYARISADLEAIRGDNPALSDHGARWPFGTGMYVTFDEEGTQQFQAGTYSGWDCPNARYQAQPTEGGLDDTAWLELGDKHLNQSMLAAEYLELPNVVYTEPGLQTDGSTICVQVGEARNRYLFVEGSGDCPAGCTEFAYWEYTVTPDGSVNLDAEPTEMADEWITPCGYG
ncbi:MAG: hypothetical protein AAF721_20340 [Myxococcota bacterium]